MTRTKVDSNLERQFVIAMVMSKPFLGGVAPIMDTSLMQTKYTRQVAEWCLAYFKQYDDAPRKAIEPLYHAWIENQNPEDDEAEAVGTFLESISAEYDESPELFETKGLNVPHLLDEVAKYLTNRKLHRLNDTVASHLTNGHQEEALTAIQEFRTVSVGAKEGYNPAVGKASLREAFAEPPEPLIEFGGDAGEFFNQALTRDSLIGVQGPEKRGKTFWCLEFVYRTLRAGHKVAMFEVGDLSKGQLTKRMAVRMAGIPLWPKQCKEGVAYPTGIQIVDGGEGQGRKAEVTYDLRTFAAPLDLESAYAGQKAFRRRHGIPKDQPRVMFSVHANSSINVAGIHGILERWKQEIEFVPDTIVIDYADILAPEDSKKEERSQINETWKALRKLSQDWHACVIVPTQANSLSYEAKTQGMKHFSNDKRKFAHVTGMLGLNQTEEEKSQGVMRLNWIVLRESEFHVSQCLWVAQCIPLAMALVKASK